MKLCHLIQDCQRVLRVRHFPLPTYQPINVPVNKALKPISTATHIKVGHEGILVLFHGELDEFLVVLRRQVLELVVNERVGGVSDGRHIEVGAELLSGPGYRLREGGAIAPTKSSMLVLRRFKLRP